MAALPSDTNWEVQIGASDSNGGGFSASNKGATGTDMTYPTSSPTMFTSTLSAVGTSTLTDSGAGFLNTMLGNCVNIAGQGVYCITGFTSSSIVTVHTAMGTFSTTSGVVGGAFLSPGQAGSVHVASNTINVKYNATAYAILLNTANVATGKLALTAGASEAAPTQLIGYQTTRGDNGTKPVLQITYAGGSSITVITGATHTVINNISVDCNSKATSTGIAGSTNTWMLRCLVQNSTATGIAATLLAWKCEVINASGSWAIDNQGAQVLDCEFHDSAVGARVGSSGASYIKCLGYRITAGDIFTGSAGTQFFVNCTAYGATGAGKHGFNLSGTVAVLVNCVAYNISGTGTCYGFTSGAAQLTPFLFYCAAGKCTTANTNNLANAIGFIPITDTSVTGPFNNAVVTANGVADFGPNNIAGAGALLRAAGYPGAFPSGNTTGYPDIGAAQHQDSGGAAGGLLVSSGMAGGFE